MSRTLTVAPPVDVEISVWVDYDADLRFQDAVVMTDEVSFSLISNVQFSDTVAVNDAFGRTVQFHSSFSDVVSPTDGITLASASGVMMADSVSVVDAGVLSRYDYAEVDYFVTPANYVGDLRVF